MQICPTCEGVARPVQRDSAGVAAAREAEFGRVFSLKGLVVAMFLGLTVWASSIIFYFIPFLGPAVAAVAQFLGMGGVFLNVALHASLGEDEPAPSESFGWFFSWRNFNGALCMALAATPIFFLAWSKAGVIGLSYAFGSGFSLFYGSFWENPSLVNLWRHGMGLRPSALLAVLSGTPLLAISTMATLNGGSIFAVFDPANWLAPIRRDPDGFARVMERVALSFVGWWCLRILIAHGTGGGLFVSDLASLTLSAPLLVWGASQFGFFVAAHAGSAERRDAPSDRSPLPQRKPAQEPVPPQSYTPPVPPQSYTPPVTARVGVPSRSDLDSVPDPFAARPATPSPAEQLRRLERMHAEQKHKAKERIEQIRMRPDLSPEQRAQLQQRVIAHYQEQLQKMKGVAARLRAQMQGQP